MFSDREMKIIKIIGRRKLTIKRVVVKLFEKDGEPFHSDIVVSNSIRTIISKCKFYKLPWTLIKFRDNKKLYIKREEK